LGKAQDYGERMYDPRVNRFGSVDPIAQEYPELSSYQFASNTPIQATDLDGLEKKLAFSGSGGQGTDYALHPTDIDIFAKRSERLRSAGFTPKTVSDGKMIVEALKEATKTDGSISAVISNTHSGAAGLYLNKDAGFYVGPPKEPQFGGADVDDVLAAAKSGTIIFQPNAVWIFAGCNAGNENDPMNKYGSVNIAELTALKLGITTIGAVGFVDEEKINGKATGSGRLVAENESTSVTFKHVGFIKFTPIKTTRVTYEGGLKFFNWTLIEPIKKVRTVITGVKKEYLGTSINPLDYVPKK
jgi:hypothetical protein